MSDPIQEIFGIPALELVSKKELFVHEGPIERFPSFLREGPLESIDSLCRHYKGPLQVANGTARSGLQVGVNGANASALLRLGLTVYFTTLKPSIPQLGGWLHAIERAAGIPDCAYASAFANAAGSGLPLHHDRFDHIFLQLVGEKKFTYAPNGYVENPATAFSPLDAAVPDWPQNYHEGFPATVDEIAARGLGTIRLRPGAAMFMPAGVWHTTAEQEGDALSLVVALRVPSRLEVLLAFLRTYGLQAPEWRRASYGGWGGPAEGAAKRMEHETFATLLADLAERMKRVPVQEAYDASAVASSIAQDVREFPVGMRFERYIRLPNSAARFEAVDEPNKVRCLVSSGKNDEPHRIVAMLLDADTKPVVDWILASRAAFTAADVCEALKSGDYTCEGVGNLLATLFRAGLVRPIPVSEWKVRRGRSRSA